MWRKKGTTQKNEKHSDHTAWYCWPSFERNYTTDNYLKTIEKKNVYKNGFPTLIQWKIMFTGFFLNKKTYQSDRELRFDSIWVALKWMDLISVSSLLLAR